MSLESEKKAVEALYALLFKKVEVPVNTADALKSIREGFFPNASEDPSEIQTALKRVGGTNQRGQRHLVF